MVSLHPRPVSTCILRHALACVLDPFPLVPPLFLFRSGLTLTTVPAARRCGCGCGCVVSVMAAINTLTLTVTITALIITISSFPRPHIRSAPSPRCAPFSHLYIHPSHFSSSFHFIRSFYSPTFTPLLRLLLHSFPPHTPFVPNPR